MRIAVAVGFIVLSAFAAYANTFSVPFLFDDLPAIEKNATIRHLAHLGEVLSPPSNGSAVTGRPLINLSFALNYAAGGTSPTGYHVVNLALHAAAALTLFGLLRRTLLLPPLRRRFAAQATPLAFVTALLWTNHPLQTESVTCVAQRTEVLVGLFYLLTFYTFVRSVERSTASHWSVLSVGACLLGMTSKEVMVSAPLMVLLYDRTFVAGSFLAAWRQRRPFYLCLASSWLLLAALVASNGGARGDAAGFGLGVAWWSYALKQCEAIILYLQLCVWPWPLVLDYGTGLVTNPHEVLPQALLLTVLVATAVTALWRHPSCGFLGLCFFAILAPSSSVVPLISQTMAEHRMYLPLAAVTTLTSLGLYALAGRRALAVLLATALLLATVSFLRNRDYRSDLSLWSVSVAQQPDNARAHNNLGLALDRRGHVTEAIARYEASLRIDPGYALAHNNLGNALAQTGRLAEALPHFEAALRLRPDYADANYNLANALLRTGRPSEAISHYQVSLRINANQPHAHHNLGNAFLQSNRLPEALREFETALKLDPNFPGALNSLGTVLLQTDRLTEAIRAFELAQTLAPQFPDPSYNLGLALLRSDRVSESVAQFERALVLKPGFADAHSNLAIALSRLGRLSEAVTHAEAALRLNPDSPVARSNVAILRDLLRNAAAQP